MADPARYLVFDNWHHIFDSAVDEEQTRFVYDRTIKDLVFAQARMPRHRSWSDASAGMRVDLLEEVTSNDYAMMNHEGLEDFDILSMDELPD